MSNLRATSPTIDGIKKLISEFFFGATIDLKPVDNTVFDIYNKRGLIKGFTVIKIKNRYRFEKNE